MIDGKKIKIHLNKEIFSPSKNIAENLSKKLKSFKQLYKIKNKNYEIDNSQIYERLIKNSSKKIKPSTEFYINKRNHIIEIIQKIGNKYNFSEHIIYLSLLYCDNLLKQLEEISDKELNLSVISCTIIAYKFAENNSIKCKYKDICKLYRKSFDFKCEEFYLKEINILKKFHYKLNIPTINDFIKCMNLIGVIYRGEDKNKNKIIKTFNDITKRISFNKISLEYINEVIAMSIVRLVRKIYDLNQNRTMSIYKRFQFNNETFNECYQKIKKIFLITIDNNIQSYINSENNFNNNINNNLKSYNLQKWNSEINIYKNKLNLNFETPNKKREFSENNMKKETKIKDSILKYEYLDDLRKKSNEREIKNNMLINKHHKKNLSGNTELPKIELKFFQKEFSENDLYRKRNWVNFFSQISSKSLKDTENGNSKKINNKSIREIYKNKNSFRSNQMFLPHLIQDYPSTKRYKK